MLVGGFWVGLKLYSDAAKITGIRSPLKLISSFIPATLAETSGLDNFTQIQSALDELITKS